MPESIRVAVDTTPPATPLLEALASYKLIEQPFLKLKDLLQTRSRRSLAQQTA